MMDVFVVHWVCPRGDAVVSVLCEKCGVTRYSSAENIAAARHRKLKTLCVECVIPSLVRGEGELGGSVRKGAVLDWGKPE